MTAVAQPTASPSTPHSRRLRDDPRALDAVFARLEERVRLGALPAAALAVGDADGEIRRGVASSDARGLSPDSYFFLASVTKPIFATSFMQLFDAGLLGLDDPVVEYLPEFATEPRKAKVTARHLLTHTSGVPDVPVETIRRARPSAAQMTRLAIEAPLSFEPGERYEYCTASFYLLARLIEHLTGTPYLRYFQERLLDPLEMISTFDPRGSARPIARVHGVGVDNRLTRFIVLRYLARAALPGGGLFATLDDLLRFGAATLRPRREGDRHVPLSAQTIALMMDDHLGGLRGNYDGEERAVHFGLGWGKPTLMRELPGSPRVVSHGGATGTRLWIDPDAEIVIVFFTNQWSADRGPEIEAVRGIYEALGT